VLKVMSDIDVDALLKEVDEFFAKLAARPKPPPVDRPMLAPAEPWRDFIDSAGDIRSGGIGPAPLKRGSDWMPKRNW
jgi:hypothetical protein